MSLPKPPASKRPFTTDYGATQGHVATARRAVRAAIFRMEATGRKHVVIEQPHGPPIDIWWNGFFGVIVKVRRR